MKIQERTPLSWPDGFPMGLRFDGTRFHGLRGPFGPWHEVLGVTTSADESTIKEAFRQRAMLWHPDRGGSTDKMAALNKAYEEALAAK